MPADFVPRPARALNQQHKVPVEDLIIGRIEAQLARVAKGVDPKTIEPLRNPWLE